MSAFNWLLGRSKPTSREIAKDRLQLVLVQDRINLSPEKMNQLKDDLIKTISRYVEIDREGIEITLIKSGRHSHLTADIPIIGVRQK
ncbi:MAG: cell division topological specificity factor MinE [Chloroflexota bacterium]